MMWQYGTEISKPLSPIYVIYEYNYEYDYEYDYEYGYEYEYNNDYVNICGLLCAWNYMILCGT